MCTGVWRGLGILEVTSTLTTVYVPACSLQEKRDMDLIPRVRVWCQNPEAWNQKILVVWFGLQHTFLPRCFKYQSKFIFFLNMKYCWHITNISFIYFPLEQNRKSYSCFVNRESGVYLENDRSPSVSETWLRRAQFCCPDHSDPILTIVYGASACCRQNHLMNDSWKRQMDQMFPRCCLCSCYVFCPGGLCCEAERYSFQRFRGEGYGFWRGTAWPWALVWYHVCACPSLLCAQCPFLWIALIGTHHVNAAKCLCYLEQYLTHCKHLKYVGCCYFNFLHY